MGAGFNVVARGNSEASIYLYEDVGQSFFGGVTAKEFSSELKALGSVETLHVRINSGGGDVFDGFAIYNQLAQHPAKVVAHIDGLAASIASVIAMAGNEIRISETGFVMIHNASGLTVGEAGDMRKMADVLDQVTASIADVYVERTGQPLDKLRGMMDAETWMTGSEALEAGFADEMVANLHIAARLDPERHKFKHLPASLAPAIEQPVAPQAARPLFDTAKARVELMKASIARKRAKDQIRAA